MCGADSRARERTAAPQQIRPSSSAGNAHHHNDPVSVHDQDSSAATTADPAPSAASPTTLDARGSNSANSRSLIIASASVMSSTTGVNTSADSTADSISTVPSTTSWSASVRQRGIGGSPGRPRLHCPAAGVKSTLSSSIASASTTSRSSMKVSMLNFVGTTTST